MEEADGAGAPGDGAHEGAARGGGVQGGTGAGSVETGGGSGPSGSGLSEFLERVGGAGRVHVDAGVLAYHLLGRAPHAELTRGLLTRFQDGTLSGQTSAVSLYQLLAEAYRRGGDDVARRASEFLAAFPGLEVVPVSAAIASQAARVRARLGLGAESCLQISTGLEAGADLYVTAGSSLRRIAQMDVVDLDDFAGGESRT